MTPKPRSPKPKPAPVRFLNLPAQQRALRKPLLAAIERVLASSHFILGPEVTALEQEVAQLAQANFGVGMNSGTDALVLALKALNIGPGDEVIVPDFTFVATATAVLLAQATPVLVDIDPQTMNLDPRQVERRITRRTKAVIPVHLYGQPADMESLLALAHRRKLAVIEDACQALGARWHGKPVGGLGTIGCFSFFPTKNLGGLGDGGMCVTQSEVLAARLKRLRQHGADRKYYHDELGYNTRLDELQAAALRVKLPYLQAWNERRQHLAALYARGLKDLPVRLPEHHLFAEHVYHQFTLRTPLRDELQAYLADQGVESAIHYPLPVHRQPLLARSPWAKKKYPVSDQTAREVLCLPIAPECTDQEVARVIKSIRAFFASRSGA